MRGTTTRQATMLSTLTTDSLIPPEHPIRRIKPVVEAVLAELGPEFDAMYARTGRQSVPPEQLLKATVLMALYSIRSERQFCERLRYDLLFKFFLDLNVDDEGFDHSTFSRNRERLLSHEVADRFFAAMVRQAHLRRYLSGERFSVDGTLLEAWASHKSFRPKDDDGTSEQRNPPVHDRSRGAPGPQRQWRGRETQLCRPPAHGASQRPDRRHGAHRGDRIRGTGHGADPAAAIAALRPAANASWA
jgi:transposase